jgi:protein involved in polysaccharide export with SLBB domain
MSKLNASKTLKLSSLAGAWLLAGMLLTGCHIFGGKESQFSELPDPGLNTGTTSAPVVAVSNPAATVDLLPGPRDRMPLRPGDALTITFADLVTPVPPIEDRIKEDGTITLMYNKTFTVAGKTRGELEKEIRSAYVPSYYPAMTVFVKLTESMRFYYVDGEVKAPSRQVYISRVTVTKAIATAGGFTEFAKKRVILTRLDGTNIEVDYKKAIRNPKLDPEVQPGDRIWVPRSVL